MLKIPVEQHRLANGLRVNLSVDPSTPLVGVNLWYTVGSRNELPGRTGFAHLFEHMMFQGSANVPKNRHFELIEGAGGTLNASTWFDRTNYYETLPSNHLELALWLESDRMGWMLPAMTSEKLLNQQEVVKNERKERYDNQPYGDWDERIQALVFPESHPYHHPVIGSMEDIGAATLEDVTGFFRTFYVPNNAILTLAGDLEPTRALELVDRYFGEIPAGDPIPPIPGTPDLPPVIGETLRTRLTSQVPLPRIYLAGRFPTVTAPEFHVSDMVATVLGRGKASRLYRSLVRDRRIAKEAASYVFPLQTGSSLFLALVTGYPESEIGVLEGALLQELEGMVRVSQSELDRAVALAETELLRRVQQMGTRADLLSAFDQMFGDPARLNSEIQRLREVTTQQVQDLAGACLGPDNRALLHYLPGGAS